MAEKTTPVAPVPDDATTPTFRAGTRGKWLLSHLWVHRPFYLWLPIVLVGVWGLLHGYHALTGRAPVDDLPVGAVGSLLILTLAAIAANCIQPRLFGVVDIAKETRWYVIAWDYSSIAFVFWLCWYALSH